MPVIYIGELETANFSFRFCAKTIEGVRALAEKTWNEHKAKTGARYSWAFLEDSLFIYAAHDGLTIEL